jgi:hypothetical protein
MHKSEKKPVMVQLKKDFTGKIRKEAKIWDPNTVHVVHKFYLEYSCILYVKLFCNRRIQKTLHEAILCDVISVICTLWLCRLLSNLVFVLK